MESQPEVEGGAEGGEGEAFRTLDETTFESESELERRGNVEEAEQIESAFTILIDQSVEMVPFVEIVTEDKEEPEYRVKVDFPWIGHGEGEDDDFETEWGRVGSLTSDGQGTWYLPEVEDEVVIDTSGEQTLPANFGQAEEAGEDDSGEPPTVDPDELEARGEGEEE